MVPARAHSTINPQVTPYDVSWRLCLAEAGGFEPPDSFLSLVFKTSAFGRSATLPYDKERLPKSRYAVKA